MIQPTHTLRIEHKGTGASMLAGRVAVQVIGDNRVALAVTWLVNMSASFAVEPLPNDVWAIYVRPEIARRFQTAYGSSQEAVTAHLERMAALADEE
jgi:hypothetical protein